MEENSKSKIQKSNSDSGQVAADLNPTRRIISFRRGTATCFSSTSLNPHSAEQVTTVLRFSIAIDVCASATRSFTSFRMTMRCICSVLLGSLPPFIPPEDWGETRAGGLSSTPTKNARGTRLSAPLLLLYFLLAFQALKSSTKLRTFSVSAVTSVLYMISLASAFHSTT